jgi:hypothetical protein
MVPNTRWVVLAPLIVLLSLAAYSWYSPRAHLVMLREAAEARDSEGLRELVDLDTVRARLKQDVRSIVFEPGERQLHEDRMAGPNPSRMNEGVDSMVETMVSPRSILAMLDRGTVEAAAALSAGPAQGKDVAAKPARRDVATDQAYESYSRYRYSVWPVDEPRENAVSLYLRRDGPFKWKLDRVGLPQTLFERENEL